MKRSERLKEIEKVWKSRRRTDFFKGVIEGDDIQWSPFSVMGQPHDGMAMCDWEDIKEHGHFMYIWGGRERNSGWNEWDLIFLRCLYTWYNLPEDCHSPLFINESVLAICIPNLYWAPYTARLFWHRESFLLGMKDMVTKNAMRRDISTAPAAQVFTGTSVTLDKPASINTIQTLGFLSK